MRGRSRAQTTTAQRIALSFVALAAALTSFTTSDATPHHGLSFRDSFEELGPLPGAEPSDPYEIRSGDWEVVDLPDVLGGRRVLRQNSRATTPVEPVVFVRAQSYRALSVQVTAALIDDVIPGSVGVVFRAPVLENQSADPNNLYLFSAVKTGFVGGLKTGQIFALFKRVGQGYYMLASKVAGTWADLTRPHEYKVSMQGGRILAFVDGRLVIDHTDVPSPDVPTNQDPFPGLPFDEGAVGLRTSGARAWFDDLVIVADDAGEGRAAAVDAYVQHGVGGDLRRGAAVQSSTLLRQMGVSALDTGFVYGTPDFDRAAIEPLENAGASAGADLSTVSADGVVVSRARLAGFRQSFADPMDQVRVLVEAKAIEATARATCDTTSSQINLVDATIAVIVTNGDKPDTMIGPFPINSSYQPNSVVFDQVGFFRIIAHPRRASAEPSRVEASALSIIFPEGESQTPEVNVGGTRVLGKQSMGTLPTMEFEIANVTAGRYCVPALENDG